jgi:CTP:molybdopterin cytidylyltransferase MocA
MTVAGVLLAAGAGTRIGLPKALLRWHDGRLLAERGAAMLREGGCDQVVVVLGARADEVTAAADLGGATVVVNADWAIGMGSSLRAGLAALEDGPAEAAVVALADQPLVGAAAVARLIAAWHDARPPAAVATYDGAPRNPVLLDRGAWADAAATATGDQGARTYLRAAGTTVLHVPCDGTGSPADVDTAEDLLTLGY